MATRSKGFRKETRGDKLHWIIDFRYLDKDGRKKRYRRDASVQTASGAASEARRLMAFAAEHGFVIDETKPATEPTSMTFRQYAETVFEEKFLPTYKPSTRRRYKDLFKQGMLDQIGHHELKKFGANEFREFALWLGKRDVKLKGPLTLVRTVLKAAVSSEHLQELPSLPALVKQSKKLPKGPVRAEVDALIAACPAWLRTACALAAFAGLRSGEIRALEVRDLDMAGRRIHVARSLSDNEVTTTKGDAERWVPIPDSLFDILKEAKRNKLPNARLVLSPRGKTPTRQRLLTDIREVQAKHGLPGWGVHSLRHFFCSELVRQRIGIETVRVLAGHTHLHTTARYLHASEDDVRAAAKALG